MSLEARMRFFTCGRIARGPGPSPAIVAVGHGENTGVDLLLDRQQVDQRLVDLRMRPVAAVVQQAAEGVLHRARHRREDMRFHRRQVHDVASDQRLRDLDAVREDVVQHHHFGLRRVTHPGHAFVRQVGAGNIELVLHRLVLVPDLSLMGVDDHGAIVRCHQVAETLFAQSLGDTLDLPRCRRTTRVPVLPADVDLQRRRCGLVERRREVGHSHCPTDIVDDPRRAGVQHGNLCGLR